MASSTPGDVVESDAGTVEGHHAGAAAAKAHGLVIAALGLAHHEEDEAAEDNHRQEVNQQAEEAAQAAGTFVYHFNAAGRSDFHAAVQQQAHNVGFVADAAGEFIAGADVADPGIDGQFLAAYDDFPDFVVLGHSNDRGHRFFGLAAESVQHRIHDDDDADDDQQVNEAIAQPFVGSHSESSEGPRWPVARVKPLRAANGRSLY